MVLRDRYQAGKLLGEELSDTYSGQDVVVLGLPRGGVPVAYEVARRLHARLDVIVARKIGAPTNPEFGVGAIAEAGELVLDEAVLHLLHIKKEQLLPIIEHERKELERRVLLYRGRKSLEGLEGKTVIVIDDGLATGVTARAAIEAVQKHNPYLLIFAAPVCEPSTSAETQTLVDEIRCLSYPQELHSISLWYRDFQQVSDTEVGELLRHYHHSQRFL